MDPKHQTQQQPKQPDRIPVRVLQFFNGHPSFNASTSVSSNPNAGNRSHYIIEYVPSMRHHRVEYRPIDGKPIVRFVHEVHVAAWEPAA
jgi:hypothetical protein